MKCHFYPRSPRGERQLDAYRALLDRKISIHAPREGSDLDVVRAGGPDDGFLSTLPARGATVDDQVLDALERFLSTLPARGATNRAVQRLCHCRISIHAPREGSD